MARYIDAEDIERFLEVSKLVGTELNADNMLKVLEATPTADVVEVVRCKDCKEVKADNESHTLWCGIKLVGHNDFCSRGKK